MAYQNISTPRIYLNIPEYLASTGVAIDSVFRTLPVSGLTSGTFSSLPGINAITGGTYTGTSIPRGYFALLGHNAEDYITVEADGDVTDIINGTFSSVVKGFSIASVTKMPTSISFPTSVAVCSILLGTYYDFPNSPDLKLSLSYEYGGIKETTTKGGTTLTNQFYNKPPAWGNGLGAWEFGGTAKYAKSGRRVWNLSFSYLSDSSVFPENAGLANEGGTLDYQTLLKYDTLQRVIHLTNGGQIPFIFQSDGTQDSEGNYNNAKADSFAIAKFDMKSFKFDQVANGVYNVKLKIREVW